MKKSICICIIVLLVILSGCTGNLEMQTTSSGSSTNETYVETLGVKLQVPPSWTASETPLWPQCLLTYDTDAKVSIDLLNEKLNIALFTEDYFTSVYKEHFTTWPEKELYEPDSGTGYYSYVVETTNYFRTDEMVRMSCFVRCPLFDDDVVTRNYHYYTTYIVNVSEDYTLLIRCEEVDDQYKYLEMFDSIVKSVRYQSKPSSTSYIESFDYWMHQGLIHGATKNDVKIKG